MVTSNLPFDEWTETFGTERLTGALLDRLTHHVNILEIKDSFRNRFCHTRKSRLKTAWFSHPRSELSPRYFIKTYQKYQV